MLREGFELEGWESDARGVAPLSVVTSVRHRAEDLYSAKAVRNIQTD